VVPESLTWSGLYPGTNGSSQYIDVKNSGSVNLTKVYIYASTLSDESARPYGTNNPQNYAAAGLITIKNETDTIPEFVGRIEWNWTDVIDGADYSDIPSNSLRAWGFYKNTSFEYVWAVGNGTGGFCNNTGALFAIEDDPDAGTTATRTPTTTGISYVAGDTSYGYFKAVDRAAFGGTGSYACIAVAYDCSKIYIYKYDMRSGFSNCGQYLTTRWLTPGDILRLTYLNAYVPKGIPAGVLREGTLTVVASTS
jgi:hypothetical protein